MLTNVIFDSRLYQNRRILSTQEALNRKRSSILVTTSRTVVKQLGVISSYFCKTCERVEREKEG